MAFHVLSYVQNRSQVNFNLNATQAFHFFRASDSPFLNKLSYCLITSESKGLLLSAFKKIRIPVAKHSSSSGLLFTINQCNEMKKALKIIGIILSVLVIAILAGITYVKTALPNTGKPEVLTIERTPERIARGEYLAHHVTVCMDCHSTRDWSKFAGPLAPGNLGGGGEIFDPNQGFPGTIYARNISPSGIGSWTDGEVFRAVTTGVSRDGSPLFPLMPYHNYGQMDKEDIYSIIAYLRTLKPVENKVPAPSLDFPINILVNTMPAPAKFVTKPDTSDLLAYGKYVINAASCVECHSQKDKGNTIPGTEFGGGMEFKSPNGTVTSANITMDPETGIGKWSKEAFVQRFKAYADSNYQHQSVGPTELNSPMPWHMYAGMKKHDLEAIHTYLSSIAPIKHTVVKFQKN
jgi:mono/diheme cytochrome c family protein